MLRFLLVFAIFSTGCIVTPIPDPPCLDPPDAERLFVTPGSVDPR